MKKEAMRRRWRQRLGAEAGRAARELGTGAWPGFRLEQWGTIPRVHQALHSQCGL